jgi:UDP-N-acetylglucosamine 2-epimerase (non-hydrolysing)
MTVLGTRPEIIRLSQVIPLLDTHCNHVLVHTGQNYDDRLNRVFFEELRVRAPDELMGVLEPTFARQIGQIMVKSEELFLKHRPDRLLILGDTNSGISAVVAKRLGISVFHMEAGNRCFDDRVPEEVNRRIIDHSSTVLMPYTERSRENLLREGFPSQRVLVTGNPIKQVIDSYEQQIASSGILGQLALRPHEYFLVTVHRAENVDLEDRLRRLVQSLSDLHSRFGYPVICSVHPRTQSRIRSFGVDVELDGVRFLPPFGFFDFVCLEKQAFCLLSDSGTVQEEAAIFGVPNVTIRDVTERPETLECGSNVLAGSDPGRIVDLVELVTGPGQRSWQPPAEYLVPRVAETVARIVLGHRDLEPAERNWRAAR